MVNDELDNVGYTPELVRTSVCSLRTRYFGVLTAHCFLYLPTHEEVLVLSLGDVEMANAPLVRIHSRCLTGEVFGSIFCECGEQIDIALEKMQAEGVGVFIYLNQEGRGEGLVAKLKAYELAETEGLDTVDSYIRQNLPIDNRSYVSAVHILRFLKIYNVRLLTNNPQKINALKQAGIAVTRESIEVPPNPWNRDYLHTKKLRMGHLFDTI